MARNILRSNNSIMLMTESPAFSTETKTGVLFAGVVGSDFGFSVERQRNKQIGTQGSAFNTLNRQPNVELSIDYIFNPMLANEASLGFALNADTPYAFSQIKDRSYNFCLLSHPDEEKDALVQYTGLYSNFSGYEAISFGNAYLNRYSIDYSLNSIGRVSTSFVASNTKFEPLTGNWTHSPAINLQNGNDDDVGKILFSGFDNLPSKNNPKILNTKDLDITLQNLQVGGQNLSGTHFIQSLNMYINFNRVGLYGLGSDYVYDRKLQFPIDGSISVSSLVDGFLSGQGSGLLHHESGYAFNLQFVDSTIKHTGNFEIEDARLESYSYSMDVNGEMSFDAQFSFQSTETKGLRISGAISGVSGTWETTPILWENADEFWSRA